jgi:hypothetical protein
VPGSQYKDQLLFNSFIGIRIDSNIFKSVSKMTVSKGACGFVGSERLEYSVFKDIL